MSGDSGLSPSTGACVELRRNRAVQELAEDGGEVPESYICKETPNGDGVAAPVPSMDVPIIDLKRLLTSSEELQKLQSALISLGCFQIINHDIQFGLLDELHENSRKFYKLPTEEKQKYARGQNDIEGYGNDMVLYENQTLDWTDRLTLLIHPEDNRKLHVWPQNPKSFREVLEKYASSLIMILDILLKSMAKALGLMENSLLNAHGKTPTLYARFNLYPPCSKPDLVQGLKPHADGSAITILLPDKDVEGLQFLKDEKWVGIQTIPHALLVNIGDQMEIMTNGIFKSPIHRVMTNSEKERISVTVFSTPRFGDEVGPVEELINDTRPRLYKTVNDYAHTYFKYYQQGKRPIEAVKLY
ncbi:OLC1v1038041C1 [Oldenlandia corymbosa var. corymbosa]|uniref:OLC1v1038041C1 n=1 Tax=Oldenlandia corymbosa var. corymbosa TaxID=529605 RepID=A0AAV1CYU3_OLDCO|nr:OLC1v1038041C1 [Oldenlandia corymbosa var. corymbosa]